MMNAFDPYDPYGTFFGTQAAGGFAQPGAAAIGMPEVGYTPAPHGVSQWGVSQWGPRQWGVSQWSGPQNWVVRQPQTWIMRQPQFYFGAEQEPFARAQPFEAAPMASADFGYMR